jgi:hypothetical protein
MERDGIRKLLLLLLLLLLISKEIRRRYQQAQWRVDCASAPHENCSQGSHVLGWRPVCVAGDHADITSDR